MSRSPIVDMHCDTIGVLHGSRKKGESCSLRENAGHIDLLRLKESNYLLQNFAMFVYLKEDTDPWQEAMDMYQVYREELEKNANLIAPVYCYADIEKNRKAGKVSSLLTVEEGAVCKGDPGKLRMLYDMGVRMMTLTWNFPNEIGFPNLNTVKRSQSKDNSPEGLLSYLNTPDTVNGLTPTGRLIVEEMERLGMIPDVSHLSDAGFYDVLQVTKKPFVASHSNARAVSPCVRNMTDDMIKALGNRGGVMGLNFCADFLIQLPVGVHNPGTIADIVKHAKHIVNVGGMEVLGLGSDFDGIETHEELAGAQGMEKLYDALVKGGFSQDQADMIFAGNVLRLYREVL